MPIDGQPTVLEEAQNLIYGERAEAYGDPGEMGANIARGWEVILGLPELTIPPSKISLCMIWMKICRELHKHQRDNLTDIAGYAGVLEKIWRPIDHAGA